MDWQWLGNPWIVGIASSIPGGLLVNWVSGFVLGKRENREYLHKVNSANRDVVHAIRPGISEGQIPSAEVLVALINATARRYGVESSDLYSATQIAEELVKEVMDSSFISSAQKAEFCSKLSELAVRSKVSEPQEIQKPVQTKTAAEYRARLTSAMSMMMGLITAVMTATFPLFEFLKRGKAGGLESLDDKNLGIFLPMIAVLVSMAMSLVVMMVYRDIRRRHNEDEKRRLEADIFKSVIVRGVRRKRVPEE